MQLTFVLTAVLLLSSASASTEKTPTQMRAMRMHEYGGSEVLRMEQVPVPTPAVGQVRIRIHATGINPIDWKIRSGRMQGSYAVTLPHIPGRDVAGTIDAVGSGVTRWKRGDAVFALVDVTPLGGGGLAEYVIVAAEDVAPRPKRLNFVGAAGIPVASLAAWRTLIEVADLQRGERVLIHGAAGGVGSTAVQLANWRGAHVIATASARNHDYLKALGADEVIDYNTTRFEDVVRDVDVVLDTVGGDTLKRSAAVLRQGGMLLSLVGRPSPEDCRQRKLLCPDPDEGRPEHVGAQLERLGQLFDSGHLSMNIEAVFPLADANKALELSEAGRARGKIIVEVFAD